MLYGRLILIGGKKKPFCPNEFVIQKHHRKEQIQLLDNIIREIEDI